MTWQVKLVAVVLIVLLILAVVVIAVTMKLEAWLDNTRPVARWIEQPDGDDYRLWECSNCGEPMDWRSMYCPHCGRLMRED